MTQSQIKDDQQIANLMRTPSFTIWPVILNLDSYNQSRYNT